MSLILQMTVIGCNFCVSEPVEKEVAMTRASTRQSRHNSFMPSAGQRTRASTSHSKITVSSHVYTHVLHVVHMYVHVCTCMYHQFTSNLVFAFVVKHRSRDDFQTFSNWANSLNRLYHEDTLDPHEPTVDMRRTAEHVTTLRANTTYMRAIYDQLSK